MLDFAVKRRDLLLLQLQEISELAFNSLLKRADHRKLSAMLSQHQLTSTMTSLALFRY